MADRAWRISLGLAALLVWSLFIGFPVLVFHLRAPGLVIGEHIHSAILFVASQLLVFWLTARPSTRKEKAVVKQRANSVGFPFKQPPQPTLWQAELAIAQNPESPESSSPFAEDRSVKVTIANYIGSSHPRRVSIEPGGEEHTLLPGQELEVIATGHVSTPSFRIVESDLVTQISVVGIKCTVSVVVKKLSHNQSSHHAPS